MGCFNSHEPASASSASDVRRASPSAARPSLLPRACANKMLSILHPKNHTVPVLRHSVRLARLHIHLDVFVAEQLARRRSSAQSSDRDDCEVLENAAFTELSPTPDGPCCSTATPTLNVIVEPRPAGADADDVDDVDADVEDVKQEEDASVDAAVVEEVPRAAGADVPDDDPQGQAEDSSAAGQSLETAV